MSMQLSRRHALRLASLALVAGRTARAGTEVVGSALQFADRMCPGVNLGNTLEALPHETSWGQPLTTQATMDGIKAAGFQSVRIPVAWFAHAGRQDRVSPAWMARVKQVVDYALKAGLIVMINTHWDGGWLNHPSYDKQAELNRRLAGLWTQIADAFRDYDERLVFAGTNEVGMESLFTPPTQEYADVQNSFNQTFVTTVRATGGNNASRFLVVQGYNTNIDHSLKHAVIPKDSVADRLMMEVHYYDPYDFTLNEKSKVWQWGAKASDPKATQTWADEPWVEKEFAALEERFVRQGIPVLIGEYGAYPKRKHPGMKAYVQDWIRVVTSSMRRHGLVPMWWDTGALIDRRTGRPREPDTLRLIVDSARAGRDARP
ncbi:MAG TPA: glycoside hydrolase family 5 protein [Burkholderiaceae bacterium]|nr:glycoside hydrolase family 5 protein [Burkholderiaceae bacterium]